MGSERWLGQDGLAMWSPPQRCPYCLDDARVQQEPNEDVVLIRGCVCSRGAVLRVLEGLARRRWHQLGIR